MNLYQKYKDSILHYTYITEEIYIKTYAVIKKDNQFYKIYLNQFNYLWKGESVVQKLVGRGYVPIEQLLDIYEIEEMKDLEEPKVNKKIIFYRKRK